MEAEEGPGAKTGWNVFCVRALNGSVSMHLTQMCVLHIPVPAYSEMCMPGNAYPIEQNTSSFTSDDTAVFPRRCVLFALVERFRCSMPDVACAACIRCRLYAFPPLWLTSAVPRRSDPEVHFMAAARLEHRPLPAGCAAHRVHESDCETCLERLARTAARRRFAGANVCAALFR